MTILPTLREAAASRGFLIGAAADMAALDGDAAYRETLRREFNLLVAENAFKPQYVWKAPCEYDFTLTDRLADFAQENGMVLRGHTLVWHQQTPRWLSDADPADLPELLRDFIHAYVGRYRGRAAMWDVVNEAVHDPGPDGAAPGLREDSPWHRALGPDYLRLAFTWAHEADPDARLYYNDYEIEDLGPKSDAVFTLLRDLKASGAPVHGIGFQGHLLNGWRATETHRANVRRFTRELDLEWQVTEADVRMELNGVDPAPEQLARQADAFRDLADLCLTEPGCRGLVFWGFTDARSWIPGFRKGWGAALPLDAAFRPKPAYTAVLERLT